MSNQIRQHYDIIINGGGIVGFTLLNSILRSPHLNRLRVLLIEQAKKPTNFQPPPRDANDESNEGKPSKHKMFSNRVSSITKASRDELHRLGVWSRVAEYAKDVTDIQVWNYDFAHRIIFQQNQGCCSKSSSPSSVKDNNVMFSVLENNRLSMAILDNILQDKQDAITWNSSLRSLSRSELNSVRITATNNETGVEMEATAPLVLGCDGFKSKVRELANFNYRERNLNKTAVVGTVRMDAMSRGSSDQNSTAYQRFSSLKDTVAALLPLDQEHCSFVISAPENYAKHLQECDESTFIDKFNRLLTESETPNNPLLNVLHNISNSVDDTLRSLLNSANIYKTNIGSDSLFEVENPPRVETVIENSRATFPLYFGTTTPKMTTNLSGSKYPQIALLGDASHRVHPLAGQGLNLGIQDAIELVRQLEHVAKSGEKVFDENDGTALCKALKRYELKRQAYIVPMSAGILSMQNLFTLMPSRMVSSINRCPWIKSTSVSVANGCV